MLLTNNPAVAIYLAHYSVTTAKALSKARPNCAMLLNTVCGSVSAASPSHFSSTVTCVVDTNSSSPGPECLKCRHEEGVWMGTSFNSRTVCYRQQTQCDARMQASKVA